MEENYVSLQELSSRLGLDKSNMRKYAIRKGFVFKKIRGRGQQLENVLSSTDAELLMDARRIDGFVGGGVVDNGLGWFYIVQIVPDLAGDRIKLGFSTNLESRLASYRTISPSASVLGKWRCKPMWERAATESIVRVGCVCIASEVYSCDDLTQLVERADAFFALMPLQNQI